MLKSLIYIFLLGIIGNACSQNHSENENQTVLNLKQNKMKIEIWSDVACPFCYLGKHNFEKAFNQFEFKDEVEVIWKSFELSPGLKTDTSIHIETFLSQRKGYPLAQVKQMNQNVVAAGKKVGINFNVDKIIVANTYLAHNLIHFAKTKNKQNEMKGALLNAYFTKGLNVDDTNVLVAIAKEVGLDENEVKLVLNQKSFSKEVNFDIEEARNLGISGVPFFVFNRKYAVNGAQESSVFLQNIQKAFNEWRAENPVQKLQVTNGKSCSVDQICG